MITLFKAFALTGGEWVIYVLLACSVLALAAMVERAIIIFREKKLALSVREDFAGIMASPDLQKVSEDWKPESGLSSAVLTSLLANREKGPEIAESCAASTAVIEKRRLEKRLLILNTLGSNSIYIGLFGTVLGVIKAFHDLAESSAAGPEVVMQGLSEALIATAAGLLVAIPSVITYNYFQRQIRDLVADTESMARMILARIKTGS